MGASLPSTTAFVASVEETGKPGIFRLDRPVFPLRKQAVQSGYDSGFHTAVGCQFLDRNDNLPAGAVEHYCIGVSASSVNADSVVFHP